ncbi:hypothetical protein [Streptomyces sp. NPDC020141]|uniref:hypothetical protein n=1 Tax=Streptomyces sp. NPDC020141 TaxID=3365065 RepID=UPI0037B1235B
MPRTSGFDQRAVAVIELRGTRIEYELFEGALAEAGWAILEEHGRTADGIADGRCEYTVEIRFPGSPLNAVRGARERVEVLADALLLDLNVLVVDLVDRDPVDLPRWFAYTRPGAVSDEADADLSRTERWARSWSLWRAERLGARDTGRLLSASSAADAGRLAARPLPHTPAPPPGTAARGSLGTARPDGAEGLGRRRETSRMLTRVFVAVIVALWVGARIADRYDQGPGAWWGFALAGLAAFWAVAASTRRVTPGKPLREILAVSLVITAGAALAGANIVRTEPGAGQGSLVIAWAMVAGVVFNGIRLLVRQWSWQRTAPWLLPALLPLSVVLLPPLGIGLHTFYLDAWGLHVEDVEIPRAHQFAASLKLMACTSLWFAVPALLGYMKHLHLYVKDRWLGNLLLLAASLALLFHGVFNLGVLAASRAGEEAVAAAAKGRAPSAYFGVEPEWVCVRPVGKAADIPVDGGELLPHRPYLRIGDAGGTAVLWDAGEKQALKAPLDKLRLLPADARPASCRPPR